MTKEKLEDNKKIVYMRDELAMTFREITIAVSQNGRPISEAAVRQIYYRVKKGKVHAQP